MNTSEKNKNLPLIGSTEYISIGKKYKNIPAKIDTGADSSSVHATHIRVEKDDTLKFVLFDKNSPYYTGRTFVRKDFKVAVIRSATGEEQLRYRTILPVCINGKKIRVLFNLSDRSKNNFPVLIGRRSITNKFLVDVSKKSVPQPPKNPKTKEYVKEFEKDPYSFHQKYLKIKKSKKGAE